MVQVELARQKLKGRFMRRVQESSPAGWGGSADSLSVANAHVVRGRRWQDYNIMAFQQPHLCVTDADKHR
jgi:hypothetical protein